MRVAVLLGLSCLLAGCAGHSVPLAPTPSPYFGTVSSQLHLGGTVYAYADIDGDAERAADFVLSLLRELPELARLRGPSRLNATSLVRVLGLDDVKAFGLSSYEQGELYHNRSFIHHEGDREGLLRLFGGEPDDFQLLTVAPADADMLWEQQIDVAALLGIIRDMSTLGIGLSPEELERTLDGSMLDLGVTWRELFEGLQTRASLVVSLDEDRNLWMPGERFMFPFTDFVLAIDGLGALADAIIRRAASDPFIRSETSERWVVVRPAIRLPPPWNAYEPALVKEKATGRIYVASTGDFFRRCLSAAEPLSQTEGYAQAFGGLPQTGNGLVYFSPQMTREMHAALDQIIAINGPSIASSVARFFLPDAGYPVGWVAENLPNGLHFSSNSASSHKSTLLALGLAALLPGAAVVAASMLGPEPGAEGPL